MSKKIKNKIRLTNPAYLFIFTLVLVIWNASVAFSQHRNTEDMLRKANHQFEKKQYTKAIPLYLEVEKNLPSPYVTEPELLYRIADCYYLSDLEKEKSILYFIKFLTLSDTVYEAHYFLGKMYQRINKNDEALQQYAIFKQLVEKDKATDQETRDAVIRALNKQITSCNYAKFMVTHPTKVYVQNLGDTVNTIYSDYAPVINNLEEKLVFTRRSPTTTGGRVSPDGDYFEDIYTCDILEGRLMKKFDYDSSLKTGYQNMISKFSFSPPVNLGSTVNSAGHEGGVSFSADAKKLFIYKNLRIWETEQINGQWQITHEIEGLSEVVNKNAYEPSISLSTDENVAYIACEQPEGYGGLDLYKSVKVNGIWAPAINLGPQINTPDDEDSPYIDPNGKRLYFSSKGHSSMGGFDVFKSDFDGKSWSIPSNMGYPINSASDDIFFSMPLRYNRGYYSSDKPNGHGKMDLYRVTFTDERPSFAEVRGLVLKGDKLLPTYSSISILDPFTQEKIENHESDSTSGNYLLLVAHGARNLMKVETPGFAPVINEFTIPPQVDFFQFYQEIHHVYIRDKYGNIIGQQITFLSAENNSNLIDSLGVNGKFTSTSYFKNGNSPDSNYRKLMTDVKFYYSEDSILKLLKTDTIIARNFPAGTEVSYATSKGKYVPGNTNDLPDSYLKGTNLRIDKKNSAVVLTEKISSDSLEKILKPELPAKINSEISADKVTRLVVFFEYDKVTLAIEFSDKLMSVVDFMKKNKNFYFEISGHTDSKGSDGYNQWLSMARAEVIKHFMLSKGISKERLTIIGKGASVPIAPNEKPDGSDNPEGRKENRRIEFRVIKQ
jgi:outer membrane protein OmpA-like peptidoglycan-associated protein